jgi:hypothetical protein
LRSRERQQSCHKSKDDQNGTADSSSATLEQIKRYLDVHFDSYWLSIASSGLKAPGLKRGPGNFIQPHAQRAKKPEAVNLAIAPHNHIY